MKRITAILIVLVSLVMLGSLLFADVPNEIIYQGRLKEYGVVVTGNRSMLFEIYAAASGGAPVWQSNGGVAESVAVSSGVFSYKLTPNVDWRGKDFWIQIKVNAKDLSPREKLTAQVYALHAQTAEDVKKQSGTINFVIGASTYAAVTTAGLNVTSGKLMEGGNPLIPTGSIIMWSGSIGSIPAGWALCDGTSGTPDLRDRFIVGAGNAYSVAATGGASTTTLTNNELPSHTHSCGNDSPDHSHYFQVAGAAPNTNFGGGSYYLASQTNIYYGLGCPSPLSYGTSGATSRHSHSIGDTGNGQSFENKPPYYALAYIMKL